ncbi:ABC transporter permease subunit [Methylocapsa sp. S129]|uniref:ABC transporter permease n=1 Tax=Methylocapsa sp. S129 TaxID=1641869 RepID=UPI00131D9E90|nr:ABC transporter permease subunit [Methylocapsa sp. S129]
MSRLTNIASVGRRALPNHWDVLAFLAIMAALVSVVRGYHGMVVPLPGPDEPVIDLDYWNLPYYALRTTLRMFAALIASLVFTFTYATLAAKSRRAEMVLIPVLDILQSVPILGFLSFTVTFFLGLFPGSVLGAECAAVFVIFTSQAWNMAFSFYQSLRTVPRDLDEVSRGFRLTGWQKFWQLEAPFALPGLIWNMMISMSGGWFMIVFSEAITVGDTTVTLPGVGSYIAKANEQGRWDAIFAAVVTMALVILAYDQLFFRPIVAWAGKFRVELSASQTGERSWVLDVLQRTQWIRLGFRPVFNMLRSASLLQIGMPPSWSKRPAASPTASRLIDIVWIVVIVAVAVWALWSVVTYIGTELSLNDVWDVILLTLYTLLRVIVLMALATVVWVPISVWIGLRPRIAERVQPLAQFLAAFPVNLLFGAAVSLVLVFHLNPDIWLSILIVFGTQWYIVFNVIAGATAFPNDLREATANFRIHGWDWWRRVILPGILPYYFTGAITASGGSWNASIVAEYVKWKDQTVSAHGVGAYIAQATEKGDFPKIVLGVAVMSIFVAIFNRLFWRQLYAYAERRLRL